MAYFKSQSMKKKAKANSVVQAVLQEDPYAVPVGRGRITVQHTLPIHAVHERENLIESYPGFFVRIYAIRETNYQTETEDTEKSMFVKFRNVLNSIGNNCEISFITHNRDIDMTEFCDRVLLKERGDKLDYLRGSMNEVVLDRIHEGKNGIEKKKYVSLGLHTDDVRKAAAAFSRMDREIDNGLRRLGSEARALRIEEALEVIHDICKPDQRGEFLTRTREADKDGVIREKTSFDFDNMRRMGLSVQDMVSPTSIQIYPKHMRFGRKYVRVMHITSLPNALSDEFFTRLTDVGFNMVATINARPIQMKMANAMVRRNITLAQTARSDEMKSLANAGLPEDMVSPETEERLEKALALRSDMINDDEKLFKVTYTLMFYADSEEQLQERTDTIYANCNASVVGVKIMTERQEEGFRTTLPLLYVEIPFHHRRTLKSSSLTAVCMPFSYLELNDPGGINYSQHLISKNLILYNRLLTQNFNGFILGVPGSGKSFSAKVEILFVFLGTNAFMVVIDPEGEYTGLAKLTGGEVIKIEPGGKWHINAMEINVSYEWMNEDGTTETNPVVAKSDFIIKLMNLIVKEGLTSVQETILDECVHALFAPFEDENGRLHPIPEDEMPTLTDLQIMLEEREEPEAYVMAQALKLYTGDGSLNTFGFRSNVDTNNRFIVYDIKDIGDKLKPIAMLIILDSIQNRMFENRREGRNTWFWVDEIYLLFSDERSASFLNMLFKRARKYGGVPTGITQNVEDLLESDTARKMLSNSNFVQILNQAPNDRLQLAQLLNLSESQVDVITAAPRGQGLIYTGSNCVPFASAFPKYTKDGRVHPIYRVLTSNMKEVREYEEEDKRREIEEQRARKERAEGQADTT